MRRDELMRRLRPFRWWARFVLAWRYGAIGGVFGSVGALVVDIGDWRNAWTIETITLILFVVVSILLGLLFALLRPLPHRAIAQLIDERAKLKDRVTTALLCDDSPFAEPLKEDALSHIAYIRPSQVFRLRFSPWHGAFALGLLALFISRSLPDLPLPFLSAWRADKKEAKRMVTQVKQVLKPILQRVKREEDVSRLERYIAKQIRELLRRAQKGRLSKKEALIKLNKLISEAEKLEREARQRIQKVSVKAMTAAEALKEALQRKALASHLKALRAILQRMQDIEQKLKETREERVRQALQWELQMLQRALKSPAQWSGTEFQNYLNMLRRRVAALQRQLASQELDPKEHRLLQEQLKSLQDQLHALKLSRQAREFLNELLNDPNFQEAMRSLAQLRRQLGQMAREQMPQLSPEQLRQMLQDLQEALEHLAQRYETDEQIRQLARQIFRAVRQLQQLRQDFG